MSIATAITNLQGKIANAYTAIENKGGTLPATQNAENLSATIDAIPAGSSTKWGMTLDEVLYADDGVLHTFGAVSGDVNFNGISSIAESGLNKTFRNSPIKSVSFPELTTIGDSGMTYAYSACTNLSSASFPELTTIGDSGMSFAFAGCSNLSSVSIPKLTTIGGMYRAFQNCTSLTDFSFTGLSTHEGVTGSNDNTFGGCFMGCSNLSSLSFPELSSVKGRGTFSGFVENCTKLSSISFPKLERVYSSPFSNAFTRTNISAMCFPELSGIYNGATGTTNNAFGAGTTNTTWPIQRFDFPKLKVISTTANDDVNCTYLFSNQKNLVEIHFGAENQSIIEGSAGYSTKWNAPNANCQIYFDL